MQPSVSEYIAAMKASEKYGPLIVAHKVFPQTDPSPIAENCVLPEEIGNMLASTGISSLYSHQHAGINLINNKKNVLIATATASGKSLIYNIPVFTTLLTNPHAHALYLFPLKALAQDQLRILETMASFLPAYFQDTGLTPAAIYDGDTSGYTRKKIRDHLPAILITNPDMLHLALLAYHDKWSSLFSKLTHVIIDEVHTYRGVFGSHMCWVIKRLLRICRLYGSNPVFVLSSATIGNPEELGAGLIGSPISVITTSGAPRPPRNVILLNPLESAPFSATMLLEAALRRGLRTIVYTQSRKMTELITMWTDKRLGDLQGKIASYRAGFLPEDRRSIEQKLANGTLLGVISTSALELGIDIGNLDICILVGYPGSIMATWQRAGRAGRSKQESLMVMIGHEDALDQHFMRNPDDFFNRNVESVTLNPDNKYIAGQHLLCTAAELPIRRNDPICSVPDIFKTLDMLTMKGQLLQSADGNTWFSARKFPQKEVNLRGSGSRYTIRNKAENTILGEIDGIRALKECHEGAIYLHMAQSWLVNKLDLEGHEILVSALKPHYFTRAASQKSTEILETYATTHCGSTIAHFGSLRVTEIITGYRKHLIGNQKVIAQIPLDLPPQIFETQGLWIEIPESLRQQCEKQYRHFMGGIHALEHAAIAVLPMLVLCDRNDIGGISHPWQDQLEGAAVFIYDGYSGGIGLTEKAFTAIDSLLNNTLQVVKSCPCDLGCPSCVHSPKCGSGNRPIDKKTALFLLEKLLEPQKHPPQTTPLIADKFSDHNKIQPFNKKSEILFKLPERYGVFDVETRRSAQEVGGWHRADRMGVSVAVLYDSAQDRYLYYEEDSLTSMIDHLFSLDLVIGFNNKRFDNVVLSAYTNKNMHALPALDLLEVIKNQLGYRLSLDRLAEHTLGIQKSGNGLQALEWFKQGRFDLLEIYCRKDVEITRDLFLFGLRQQYLLFQNKAGKVVRLPVTFNDIITKILATNRKKSRPDKFLR